MAKVSGRDLDIRSAIEFALGVTNACTHPVVHDIAPPLRQLSDSPRPTNRYSGVPAEPLVEAATAPRPDLGGRSIAACLGFLPGELQCLDFATVTAARMPAARPVTAGPAEATRQRIEQRLAVAQVDGAIADAFRAHAADDVARMVELAVLGSAEGASSRLAAAGRALLGWSDPTVFLTSGTYFFAHLGILAGARTDGGGGLLFTTTETGGNAVRAGRLCRPHFGADLAGFPVDASVETPVYGDGRAPAIVHAMAWRDAGGRLHADDEHLAERVGAELDSAIDRAAARNHGRPVRVVVHLPDRPKTAVDIDLATFYSIVCSIRSRAARRDVELIDVVVDGCQSRGLTATALADVDGPVAWFRSRGVEVDGVTWTTSKGPGGLPFAAACTMTPLAHAALIEAIEAGESSCAGDDGFAGRYVCVGDFDPPSVAGTRLERRAVDDPAHLVRLLTDLPRLWRWCAAVQDRSVTREVSRGLAAELREWFVPDIGPTDPTVICGRFRTDRLRGADAAVVARLLRWGFDLPSSATAEARAAALLPTPIGQPVEEAGDSVSVCSSTELDAVGVLHDPLIRFSVPLELIEAAIEQPADLSALLAKIGRLLRSRLASIIDRYDELAAALQATEASRQHAEVAAFRTLPPRLRREIGDPSRHNRDANGG